ncbi:MAG: sulfatase-like hydrolase/transferase [Clostridiales bacterium]|nr:sulfatase-like hydrolase/transferase [Candidatus Equinaster intestinalis]
MASINDFFKKASFKGEVATVFLMPLVMTYYELVFKISTSDKAFSLGTLFTVIYSIAIGLFLYLLCSISKKRKTNRIIAICIMIVLAVVFLIEYFVFKQFKIFYDVNTVLGGAGGVATGFWKETLALIFSWDGLLKIALYALPIILYSYLGKLFAPAKGTNACRRIFAALLALIITLLNTGILLITPVGDKYSKEYNFQDAVSNFGLITALRLDIFKGDDSGEFTEPEKENENSESSGSKPVVDPIIYKDNVMNIDFDALSKNASKKLRDLDKYVASLTPSKQNEYIGMFKGKNLIFITAEAFAAEVIDPDITPTLYRMATKGINFTDYYQQASSGTTGGEYQNLFGMLPTAGGMSVKNTATHNNYFTMGNQLNRLGYYGKAYHANSHTFYDRNKTHINLGYSDGFMGYGSGMEKYVQNLWPQSDIEAIKGIFSECSDKEHFNIYYMSVSGHNNYSTTSNSMTKKNWEVINNIPKLKGKSDEIKGYYAAQYELDKALEYLIGALEEKGIADNTVICIAADHFPYGLDNDAKIGNMPYLSELYGYNVDTTMKRDHNRLIIWSGCLEEKDPIIVSSPTSSLDILPTLSNLFGTEFDSRLLPGRDVFSDAEALVFNTGYDWKTDLGTYTSSTGEFVANEGVTVPEGYVERIKGVVRNKIKFCTDALDTDYYAHLFGKNK